MNILALDTARLCGWALWQDGKVSSGTWKLKDYSKKETRVGIQWDSFFCCIDMLHRSCDTGLGVIVYEDVVAHHNRKRSGGSMNVFAAHAYGGYKAILELWAFQNNVEIYPIGVTQNKKIASGKGNTDKAGMIQAAQLLWPDQKVYDDNQADALCLLASYLELKRFEQMTKQKGQNK